MTFAAGPLKNLETEDRMSEQQFAGANRAVSQAAVASCKVNSSLATDGVLRVESGVPKRHRLFLLTWYGVNFLLIVAVVAAAYTTAWEYSTRRYLKGFSDAIIPDTAPVEEKIQSILSWMSSPRVPTQARFCGRTVGSQPYRYSKFPGPAAGLRHGHKCL